MRPRVTSPTGTVIGPPVSTTSVPRARPSVVSIATARTRSSPRCCCTSQMRFGLMLSSSPAARSRVMSSAWLISGSSSGNTASMTTPWISSMRPTLRRSSRVSSFSVGVVAAISISCFALSSPQAATTADVTSDQGLGPGDDFHDLLGDLGLARAVHLEREVVDDLAGVLGRVAHRGHAGAVLGRGRLEQRAVDRDLDVVGDEALRGSPPASGSYSTSAWWPEPSPSRSSSSSSSVALEDRRLLERQQRLAPHLLDERRDVAVVEDLDAVDLVVDVGGDEVLGDLARVGVGRAVGEARVAAGDLAPAEAERRDAAAARGVEDDVAALALVLGRGAQAGAQDLRVERAGEAAVARDEQDRDPVLVLVLLEDRQASRSRCPRPRRPGGSCAGSRPRTGAGRRSAARRAAGARRRPSPSPA